MTSYPYLLVLAGCLVATAPLEILLGTRVYARWRRLGLTLLPVALVFVSWDVLAAGAGHWGFDDAQLVGLRLGGLPLEELLFFVVVPICAVLTLEAVRAVKGWTVGDEQDGG
jgi:lycopene cyclase domain-containing protein